MRENGFSSILSETNVEFVLSPLFLLFTSILSIQKKVQKKGLNDWKISLDSEMYGIYSLPACIYAINKLYKPCMFDSNKLCN